MKIGTASGTECPQMATRNGAQILVRAFLSPFLEDAWPVPSVLDTRDSLSITGLAIAQ